MTTARRTPVNVYRQNNRIMVATPVPGMEPVNIRIEVHGRRVTVQATLRGPGQDRKQQYLRREWSVGPYERTVTLPTWVDPARANATYDNGVLVVILPIAARRTSGTIMLRKVGTAKGRLRRHVGANLRPADATSAETAPAAP